MIHLRNPLYRIFVCRLFKSGKICLIPCKNLFLVYGSLYTENNVVNRGFCLRYYLIEICRPLYGYNLCLVCCRLYHFILIRGQAYSRRDNRCQKNHGNCHPCNFCADFLHIASNPNQLVNKFNFIIIISFRISTVKGLLAYIRHISTIFSAAFQAGLLLLTSHVFPTQVKTHHQSRVVNDGIYVLHTLKKCQDFGSGF